MAQFASTGNPMWDQDLSALAGIFPDPGRTAQAGLYGAEAGKAMLQGQQLQEQARMRKALADALGMNGAGAAGGGTGVVVPPGATAAPPGAVTPPAGAPTAPPPGMGTDGRPMPPDATSNGPMHPGTFQPPGGGVKYAPPAAVDGTPAPVMFSLPQIVGMAAMAGIDPNLAAGLTRTVVNQWTATGRMDKSTADRILSGLGDPHPLDAATNIAVTGMNNRTTLENTRLTTEGRLREIAAGTVQVQGPNGPRYSTQGAATSQGLPGYDSAREIAGDVPVQTTPSGAPPGTPPVFTQTRNAPGQQPFNAAQDARDKETVTYIEAGTGQRKTTTRLYLRQHPEIGTEAVPSDLAPAQTMPQGGGPARLRPTSQAMAAPDATAPVPAPMTTDQEAARRQAELAAAGRSGDQGRFSNLLDMFERSMWATTPRMQLTPEQEGQIQSQSDKYFTNMYPARSGLNIGTAADAPAVPDQEANAWHMARTFELERGPFRSNPAAASAYAWDEMRAKGFIPTNEEMRSQRWRMFGEESPSITGDKKPRLMVHLIKDRLPRDANGNVVWPNGGVAGPRALADTVAPDTAASMTSKPITRPAQPTPTPVTPNATQGRLSLPRGAVAVAPRTMPDGSAPRNGTPIHGSDGSEGYVWNGFIYRGSPP